MPTMLIVTPLRKPTVAHATAAALRDLLAARVEAERMADQPAVYVVIDGEERPAVIADLDAAIEHAARALARSKNAPVVPLPVPRVARAAA
jgi:hypothetical protein